jgi:hypothetical protein
MELAPEKNRTRGRCRPTGKEDLFEDLWKSLAEDRSPIRYQSVPTLSILEFTDQFGEAVPPFE